MKKTLALLMLACLMMGAVVPVALADSVSATSSTTVAPGKAFTLTFEYNYTGDIIEDMDMICAVDASQNVSVSAHNGGSYGYMNMSQITRKSFNLYIGSAYDMETVYDVNNNPIEIKEYRDHEPIKVTVSGTAPKSGSFMITFTPRGRASLPPFEIKVDPKKK